MSMLYSAQYNEYNGDTPVFKGGVPLSGEHQGFYIGRNAVSGIFGVTKTDNVISAVKVLDYLMVEINISPFGNFTNTSTIKSLITKKLLFLVSKR